MNHARPFAILIAVLSALTAGCGPKRIPGTLQAGQAQVVLLPDPGDGAVGSATVSNSAGAVDLGAARESTTAARNQPPTAVAVLSEADANRLFGEVLSGLPREPVHFILYFQFQTDELTDESRALVPRVLEALRNYPFPDVAVIGHTDSTGTSESNAALGLTRANTIRNLLVQAGVSPAVIEVTSHGEADLLVKTGDGVLEPRNRRVEITVR